MNSNLYMIMVPDRYRQMDRQTDDMQSRNRVASHSKNYVNVIFRPHGQTFSRNVGYFPSMG